MPVHVGNPLMGRLRHLALFLLLTGSVWGVTTDPADTGQQYGYGENVGWVNTKPVAVADPGMHIAQTGVTGWLWLENAGWVNLSCRNTASCADNPFEVTHAGGGLLEGNAWAENAGWVSFSCVNTGSCATNAYGVLVDLVTGQLSGFAWSENLGWISFNCQDTASCGNNNYRVDTEVPLPALSVPAFPTIYIDGFE